MTRDYHASRLGWLRYEGALRYFAVTATRKSHEFRVAEGRGGFGDASILLGQRGDTFAVTVGRRGNSGAAEGTSFPGLGLHFGSMTPNARSNLNGSFYLIEVLSIRGDRDPEIFFRRRDSVCHGVGDRVDYRDRVGDPVEHPVAVAITTTSLELVLTS
jgi:hypothetical protein